MAHPITVESPEGSALLTHMTVRARSVWNGAVAATSWAVVPYTWLKRPLLASTTIILIFVIPCKQGAEVIQYTAWSHAVHVPSCAGEDSVKHWPKWEVYGRDPVPLHTVQLWRWSGSAPWPSHNGHLLYEV